MGQIRRGSGDRPDRSDRALRSTGLGPEHEAGVGPAQRRQSWPALSDYETAVTGDPVLIFTPGEWDAFIIGAKQGELRAARASLVS